MHLTPRLFNKLAKYHFSGYLFVVRLQGGRVGHPPGQKLARLDGHGGQLQAAVDHVSNGVDVGDVGLFGVVHRHFFVLGIDFNAGRGQTEGVGVSVTADGEDDCVEDILVLRAVAVLGLDPDLAGFAGFHLLQGVGHAGADEVDALRDHVVTDLLGDVLIEAAQQDGPDHDGDVDADPVQEAGRLQGNVTGTNHQGFARIIWQAENGFYIYLIATFFRRIIFFSIVKPV